MSASGQRHLPDHRQAADRDGGLDRHRRGCERRRHCQCHWVCNEGHFEQLISRRFSGDGPLFLAAKIDDKPGPIQTRAIRR